MPHERDRTNHHPGSMPEIHADAGSITFLMTPTRLPDQARLVIRCDADGELWVSIAPVTPPPA